MTHLKSGSVAVAPREHVREGQLLARVGNSANSSEPHLHIEIFDGRPRRAADAYPLYFYDVVHNGAPQARALAKYGDTMKAAQPSVPHNAASHMGATRAAFKSTVSLSNNLAESAISFEQLKFWATAPALRGF